MPGQQRERGVRTAGWSGEWDPNGMFSRDGSPISGHHPRLGWQWGWTLNFLPFPDGLLPAPLLPRTGLWGNVRCWSLTPCTACDPRLGSRVEAPWCDVFYL